MAFGTLTAITYLNRGGGGAREDGAEILALIAGTSANTATQLGTATGGAGDVTGTGAFQIPTGFRIIEVQDAGGTTLVIGGVSATPVLYASGVVAYRNNTSGAYNADANAPVAGPGMAILVRAIKVA